MTSITKSINAKFIVCTILAFFAALGTVSYGYKFSGYLPMSNTMLVMSVGAVFALCAMLANMMLGSYSLMNINSKKGQKIQLPILLVSTIGAVPYGFLCFFGYQKVLPQALNISISLIVVIVNAGIGYTAFQNLWLNLRETFSKSAAKKSSAFKNVIQVLGFLIGLAISLLTYLAACSGITDLLMNYHFQKLVDYHVGYYLAILSWIPCAALFANSNQIVAGELFDKLAKLKKFIAGIDKSSITLFLFCLFSGTAIAQMTSDSFEPWRHIPELFKADWIQITVQYMIPVALFSSAALNYFSINKFFEHVKK